MTFFVSVVFFLAKAQRRKERNHCPKLICPPSQHVTRALTS
jgi:hypothetical protein